MLLLWRETLSWREVLAYFAYDLAALAFCGIGKHKLENLFKPGCWAIRLQPYFVQNLSAHGVPSLPALDRSEYVGAFDSRLLQVIRGV